MTERTKQQNEVTVLRNQLDAPKLMGLLKMALAEQRPLEQARNAYLQAPERKKYNEWLSYLGLTQFRIDNIYQSLTFDEQAVKTAVSEKLIQLRQKLEGGIENRYREFDEKWAHNLVELEQSIKPESAESLLDKVPNSLKPPSGVLGCLGAIILTGAIAGVGYGLIEDPGYGVVVILGALVDMFIITPIRALFRLIETPYNAVEYWFHMILMYGGVCLASIPAWLFISGWRNAGYEERVKATRLREAHKLAQQRHENDKRILAQYREKEYNNFINDNVANQLNRSYNLNGFYRWVDTLNADTDKDRKELETLSQCESQFPGLLQKVFELDTAYTEESEKYHERIEKGESMVATLPEQYQNVNDILVAHLYVEEGRAENWKEVVNLMHDERHKHRVEDLLSEIVSSIGYMDKTLDQFAYNMELQGQTLRRDLEFSARQQDVMNRQMREQTAHLQTQTSILADSNEQQRFTNLMLLGQLLSS